MGPLEDDTRTARRVEVLVGVLVDIVLNIPHLKVKQISQISGLPNTSPIPHNE